MRWRAAFSLIAFYPAVGPALADRSDEADRPIGDIVGALQALTGLDHRYDTAAWRWWWAGARNTRPE